MNVRLAYLAAGIVVGLTAVFALAGSQTSQTYRVYSGDFNGDGATDVLYIATGSDGESGIAVGDGNGLTIPIQAWSSDYLGVDWAGGRVQPIIADFNADGRSDLLLQASGSSDSFLIFSDPDGRFTGIQQSIPPEHLGVGWSTAHHELIAGDFTGDGRSDLLMQSTSADGTNLIVVADSDGRFTLQPLQEWQDGFLGYAWSTEAVAIQAGDFDGDGRADLAVVAKPGGGDAGSKPVEPVSGIVYASDVAESAVPFAFGEQQIFTDSRLGVDWSKGITRAVADDIDNDGRADLSLLAAETPDTVTLLSGRSAGPAFENARELNPTKDQWLRIDPSRIVDPTALIGAVAHSVGVVDATATAGTADRLDGSRIDDGADPSPEDDVSASARLAEAETDLRIDEMADAPLVSDLVTPKSEDPGIDPKVPRADDVQGAEPLGGPMALASAPTSVAAGRTPGTFAVSNAGAATYSIPLWMPPGVGAVSLELGLVYNSRGPNGVVGMGWSLSGLSAITRCNKTWAQDGTAAAVTLTAADRFCLDGQQLKLVSGTYGGSGSVYATEIESFSKVVANGQSGNGPASFTVTTKNGLIYEYGLNSDAQIKPGGGPTIRTWALSQIRDRQGSVANSGNRIDITYINDTSNGSYRVSSIAYPRTASGQGPFYTVTFGYAARPSNDIPSGYLAGYLVREAHRLTDVSVAPYGSSTPIKAYYLTYSQGTTTNRSRLASVQECSGASCFPATTIGYQNGLAGWSSTLSNGGSGPSIPNVFAVADLNGDGRTDVLYATQPTGSTYKWWAKLSTGSGYGSAIDTGISGSTSTHPIVADFNADGSDDLLYATSGTWSWYRYTGAGFVGTSTGSTAPAGAAIDANGDGLPDLVGFQPSTVPATLKLTLNTTVAGQNVSFSGTSSTVWTGPAGRLPGYVAPGGPLAGVRTADFNGDGRQDIYLQTSYYGTGFPPPLYSVVDVLISNGSSFTSTLTLAFPRRLIPLGSFTT